ncbi:MAG TPA: MIP family channel protein [Vicinamibacteria bacterium]|nr:MIP family channel protein [Vicinamibacteria bacterium]
MLRETGRAAVAEFLGTFVLILSGTAVVAQVVLSGGSHGTYLSINIGWGLAVTMAVYVAGDVSGGHLNPALTLALAVCGRFPWRRVLAYWGAQTAGAFTASAVTFAVYHEALTHFDGGIRRVTGPQATAGIWATYPQGFLSNVPGGLADQIVGTALLVGLVFALTDRRNLAPDPRLAPVLFGAAVVLIGMTFGYNAGYAINPARDFGPRLFTALAGWGSEVFRAGNHWWWIPIVGPCLGGMIGGLAYDLLISKHHPPEG